VAGEPHGSGAGEAPPLVTGRVVITAAVAAFGGATVHVYLEDVSRADGAAVVVAESALTNVRHEPRGGEGTTLPFELRARGDAPPVDPAHEYAVRVWVDRDGDGKDGAGDLYSDQRYAVLTRGRGADTTVTLDSH